MAPARGESRLRALDGLRGVAALVVVLSHIVPSSIASLSEASQFDTDAPGFANWLLRSPLAIWWAGTEFVTVFFVLSAFVLTRALTRSGDRWSAFYASRLVRLYLPAWASLILASILMLVVPPAHLIGGVGYWLESATPDAGLTDVIRSGALVLEPSASAGSHVNAVLWSLRWEVIFSMALPLLLMLTESLRRYALPLAIASLFGVWAGPPALAFIGPFVIGMLLALHEPQIWRLRTRATKRSAALLLPVTMVLMTADLWLPGATRARGAGGVLVVLGAVVTVLAPLLFEPVARALCVRPVQWLGSRSFSLYLVHLPIVLAFANGLRGPSFLLLSVLSIPVSLATAEAFFRVVERPSHRLARTASKHMGAGGVEAAELLPASSSLPALEPTAAAS